ncbi:MAG: class II fructose-bisphosphate aldolase [Coriobacteriaceae bacterium]|nr:class II fructose-bisphosphate aldolase [Coriobacteriaceae bacterium]
MPLIPLKPVLDAARAHGYAQGAFNVNAVCQAKAAIEVHEMFRSPAILQGADLANAFMGGRADFANGTIEDKIRGAANIGAAVRRFAEASPVPVVLHLDHGHDLKSVIAAIDGGYTSVMIDGSALPFEENKELTREVVRYAHARGVSVEGELGVLAGVEDDVSSLTSTYTDPLAAVEFIRDTKVDALAISYGTMHGPAKGKDVKLRREIPTAIRECLLHAGIECALVSHGSSTVPAHLVEEINRLGGSVAGAHGIPVAELTAAIPAGISKINVDTDIRLAVTRNLRELFRSRPELMRSASVGAVGELIEQQPAQVDPRAFLPPIYPTVMRGEVPDEDVAAVVAAIEAGVKEAVGSLVVTFGSVGRAPLVERAGLAEMAERYEAAGL